ncbi:hypothetical protein D3C71_1060370 [compost metagenome]
MSNPKRHHYLPQSYLEAWARDDGEITQYSRPWKDLLTKPCTPYATGFEDHLYSLHGEPDPKAREQVEVDWMQRIDNDAALILKQMIASPNAPLTQRQSDAWIAFLTSMIFRTPARLRWMHEEMRSYDYAFTEDERQAYEQLRPTGAPARPEQYFIESDREELSVARMQLMLRMIQSRIIGEGLAKMIWAVHRLQQTRYGFLTGDDPIITSNGLRADDAFVILPLSPEHLFIAAGSQRALWSYTSQTDRAIERAINDAIVVQANTLVIGRDDRQANFVANRLGRKPAGAGFLGRHTWKCP